MSHPLALVDDSNNMAGLQVAILLALAPATVLAFNFDRMYTTMYA